MKSLRLNLDALGMCASTLCMIHCLMFPLLLAALPMWKLTGDSAHQAVAGELRIARPPGNEAENQAASECCLRNSAAKTDEVDDCGVACCATPTDFWIHVGLLAGVAPLGFVAWGMGYRNHRRPGVIIVGLVGVLLLTGALLFGTQLLGSRGEQVMTVLGSICMVSAHLWNRHQCRCCSVADSTHSVETAAGTPEAHQLSPTS